MSRCVAHSNTVCPLENSFDECLLCSADTCIEALGLTYFIRLFIYSILMVTQSKWNFQKLAIVSFNFYVSKWIFTKSNGNHWVVGYLCKLFNLISCCALFTHAISQSFHVIRFCAQVWISVSVSAFDVHSKQDSIIIIIEKASIMLWTLDCTDYRSH